MKFNSKARLDRSQVQDRRGTRSTGGGFPGPGGSGGGLPGGMPVGGGIGGIILMVIIFFVASQCGGGVPGLGGGSGDTQDATSDQCLTGADTDEQDCRVLASVNSIQAFWEEALPDQAGVDYETVQYVTFSGGTESQCGQASSAMGPFYCPVDRLVYVDLTFFEDMLVGQLGGSGGDFAEAYVMAHEYGHHVQDLLGTLSKAQSGGAGPTSGSVRVELQADCFAGVWGNHATTVENADGEVLIEDLTDEDISEAIDAATAVGDDRIQQRSGGQVDEESWTHGSAEQRVRWFQTGYEAGDISACDTFATSSL
ncbi:MAG: neutral zinc metallopeptidase [Nocardioidaceae bacterium]